MISPTSLDFWVAKELAGFLGHFTRFDEAVQGGIRHDVLGGFWYALSLLILWLQAARKNGDGTQVRILTITVGSTLTILLTFLAAGLVSWPPPIRHPGLAALFPTYLEGNPNTNCFPSQSTALYGSIAAGVHSLHKGAGWALWVALPLLVSLPRIYVGGHYLSDALAGVVLGLVGYASARYLLEARLISRLDAIVRDRRRAQTLLDVVLLAWILEVAVEFRDVVWLLHGIRILIA